MSAGRNKICLLTTTHVSYNPRLVKEADALANAGFDVRVVAVNAEPVKAALDAALMKGRPWRLQTLDAQRGGKGHRTWLVGSVRQKLFKSFSWLQRSERGAELALSRFLCELTRLATAEPADLFIGHTLQVLPVVVQAAQFFNVRAGMDFEDSFTDMRPLAAPPSSEDELWTRVEKNLVHKLDYLSAASPGVAQAVADRHGITAPLAVLNTFPLGERPLEKDFAPRPGPLRLYWFSQTVGRDRGLSEAITALGLLPPGSAELHLRGHCDGAGRSYLQSLVKTAGAEESSVVLHAPEAPHRMVSLAAQYDVGLALEMPVSVNRIICMRDLCTNKVFTYLLAGLALAATSEHDSGEVYAGAGFAYPHGQPEKLAAGLRRWLEDPGALRVAKEKAWRLGETRFNWDLEKQKLVAAVRHALNT